MCAVSKIKLGIHGSPTCELVYKNAKAEICGERKLGLIKYVMALMNGARLGIAAQSVGISQAAYNEGLAYARDREQFGKAIINFPAVYDMLALMKPSSMPAVPCFTSAPATSTFTRHSTTLPANVNLRPRNARNRKPLPNWPIRSHRWPKA
mgnify:CR=1 FL=1